MSHPAGHASTRELHSSESDEVLAELMEALGDPGCINPALAASVTAQARSLREVRSRRLRGTAFDGRLFATEEAAPPHVRVRTLV